MKNEYLPTSHESKNKCISCAYLCHRVSGRYTGLHGFARSKIRTGKEFTPPPYGSVDLGTLTCFKHCMSDEEIQRQPDKAKFPSRRWFFWKQWQLYFEGIHPKEAWQQEHNGYRA